MEWVSLWNSKPFGAVSFSKKPFTRVSKPMPAVHGRRGLERGWQKRLAKGWRKVGEHAPTLHLPRRPFRRVGL